MIRAILMRSLFALAALSALAASSGLAVAPHEEPPGAPPVHDHVLGAYRFAFLMSPVVPPLAPDMARLHRVLMASGVPMDAIARMPGMSGRPRSDGLPRIASASASPIADLALEFALLVMLVPRLPRPTLRKIAELPPPHVLFAQWRLVPVLPPPRLIALP